MGVQVSFSIWHSDIGIPNYIKKLPGIAKFEASYTQIDGIQRQNKGASTEKGKSWQQKTESTNHKNKMDKLH